MTQDPSTPSILSSKQRAALRRLSPDTKRTVMDAVREWARIAQHEGYAPITEWRNFDAEVWHSALLWRILNGDRPYVEKPPTRHSYPDYDEMHANRKEMV